MNDEEKKIPTEGSVTQTDDKNENPGAHTEHTSYVAYVDLETPRLTDGLFSLFQIAAETAEVILLKALILQVLCLYQKVVPHLVSQCKFDFSKLFKGLFVSFRSVCIYSLSVV